MLVAIVVLDLVQAECLCPFGAGVGRGSRAGWIVTVLVAGALVDELEMSLEVCMAREGVDGTVWNAAGVAALTFTALQLGFISLCVSN